MDNAIGYHSSTIIPLHNLIIVASPKLISIDGGDSAPKLVVGFSPIKGVLNKHSQCFTVDLLQ